MSGADVSSAPRPAPSPTRSRVWHQLREFGRSLWLWVTVAICALLGATIAIAAVARAERSTVDASTAQLRNNFRPAQNEAGQLTQEFLSQQSAQRGFLLSGDPALLDPYRAGRLQADATTQRLRRLLSSDPIAERDLAATADAGTAWQENAAVPAIAARTSGKPDDTTVQQLMSLDRTLFDVFRARAADLQQRTDQLVDQEITEATTAERSGRIETTVALFCALGVAVLALVLMHYYFTRPLRRFLVEVRQVAAGEHPGPLRARGPDELVIVADAVERMRTNVIEASAEAARAEHRLVVRDERDRVAADLHDLIVQRVFGLGMSLNSTAARFPELAAALEPLIDETDRIVKELRNVIFDITPNLPGATVRTGITELVRESSRSLGFTPELTISGPVDTTVSAPVAEELLAVLRESLSNTARHAHARSVWVDVVCDGTSLRLVVVDDGIGPSRLRSVGHGTRNIGLRAKRLGGTAEIQPGREGGTRVEWHVPLGAA